jgi:uncharacterized membrane protein YpjA
VNVVLKIGRLRDRLVRQRAFLGLLLGVNLVGAAYGFAWYASQLRTTAVWLWPFTADSPMSLFFFALALVSWLWGRRWPVMEALGYLGLLKYGFWTMLVVGAWWLRGEPFLWIDLFLFISHGLMALQALVLVGSLPVRAPALGAGFLWYLLNDYLDYLHPGTPTMELLPEGWLIRAISLASTPVFAMVLGVLGDRADRGRVKLPSTGAFDANPPDLVS